jgi:hypothetical protein
VDEIVERLRNELEPCVKAAATQAAAQTTERELAHTREWFEAKALPKAVRVAQHEAYNVLRKYGVIGEPSRGARAHSDIGRSDYTPPEPRQLSGDEIADVAEACVALLEVKGQSVELTLSEMSAEAGGFLLPKDAPRVREKVNSLLSAYNGRGGK